MKIKRINTSTRSLTLALSRRPENARRFAAVNSDPVNFGYTRAVWWLRVSLPGGAPAGEELMLEIAFPSIDRIEFHVPEPAVEGGPRYWKRLAGDTFTWDAREVKHRNHVFRFAAPQHPGAHEYFLRVQSQSVLTVPLALWRPEAFAERDRDVQLLLGLFYGLALAPVLYNLMLFVAVQDRLYFYYVLYAAAFGVFLMGYDGLAFQYLWPGSVWAATHAVAMTLALTLALGALFAHAFLDMRRIAPRAAVAMRGRRPRAWSTG